VAFLLVNITAEKTLRHRTYITSVEPKTRGRAKSAASTRSAKRTRSAAVDTSPASIDLMKILVCMQSVVRLDVESNMASCVPPKQEQRRRPRAETQSIANASCWEPYRSTTARDRDAESPIMVAVTRAESVPKAEDKGSPTAPRRRGMSAACICSSSEPARSEARTRLGFGAGSPRASSAPPSSSSYRSTGGVLLPPAPAGGRLGVAPPPRRPARTSSRGTASAPSPNPEGGNETATRSFHPRPKAQPRAPAASPRTTTPRGWVDGAASNAEGKRRAAPAPPS